MLVVLLLMAPFIAGCFAKEVPPPELPPNPFEGFDIPTTTYYHFSNATNATHVENYMMNGTLILKTDLAKVEEPMYDLAKFKGRLRKSGYFGFAGHGDPVSFRNVSIKELR